MVFIVFNAPPRSIEIELDDDILTSDELREAIRKHSEQYFGNAFDFYLLQNGKIYYEKFVPEGRIHVVPRLRGGKGGFGSMLRAIGAQIEKTTNREACRDLSGRRLRDINEEKRLKKWLAEKAEREQEAYKRKKRKLEKLNGIVKHEFVDEEYTKARLEIPEKIHESVEEGLKAALEEPSGSEIVKKDESKPVKKIKGNLWVDDLESLEDSESNSESDGETPTKKAKHFA